MNFSSLATKRKGKERLESRNRIGPIQSQQTSAPSDNSTSRPLATTASSSSLEIGNDGPVMLAEGDISKRVNFGLKYSGLESLAPNQLEIRTTPSSGRGLFTTSPKSPGLKAPFPPYLFFLISLPNLLSVETGTQLLETTPLISILDNESLQERCSTCFRSEGDLNRSGGGGTKSLMRCTKCKVILYCSPTCQTLDWFLHKHECPALTRTVDLPGGKIGKYPDTIVRALGRLVWMGMGKGGGVDLKAQMGSMQSHLSSIPEPTKESYFHLSLSLSHYVGQEFATSILPTSLEFLHFISRVLSNSFTLTSPYLAPIGISLSPLFSLLNHSCIPNSVVVFSSFPSPSPSPFTKKSKTKESYMKLIAIRPIAAHEEIKISYLDTALPLRMRQEVLKDKYSFECRCGLCCDNDGGKRGVDMREAVICGKVKSCDGLCDLPDLNSMEKVVETKCEKCGHVREVQLEELKKWIQLAELRLRSPDRSPTNLPLTELTTLGLSPTSHPFLPLLHLLNSSSLLLPLYTKLYGPAHPLITLHRTSILRTTLNNLLETSQTNFWDDTPGVRKFIQEFVMCEEEVERNFGRDSQVGEELREQERFLREGVELRNMGAGER